MAQKEQQKPKKILTDSNFPVSRVYSTTKNKSKEEPGKYPYTRGIHAEMYRERFWTMRQYSGFGDAKQTNERFKFMLEKGQTGLSMAFDLPTQIGHDADSSQAEGEVGKVGVSISSLKDMLTAFDGIPLGKVSSSMTINSTASTLLAYYIAVGESQGFASTELRGTTQNDILKEYVARNTYIYPPQPSMRLIGDMIGYCAKHVPQWYPVSISGYHMREAGSTATQEVAFTLANAIAYIQTCLDRGLKIDDFAPRLSFFFCCTIEFFEEIAKFRVARKIYAEILKEKFHAKDPKSLQLKFHTQTSGESLTAQQPDNNIVRVAIQSMAAVLGGTQSLHTNSRDEALALPTAESAKIALRTQQIVAHESGITKTVDPMAGSYYLEYLCDEIAVINKGKILAVDTPNQLKATFGQEKTITIHLLQKHDKIPQLLLGIDDCKINYTTGTDIIIQSSKAEIVLSKVLSILIENNIPIEDLSAMPTTLEEIFLKMVRETNASNN